MEVEATTANFQSEVLGSATPVLVDFWASWCGPCKMIKPHVEAIAKEYAGRLKVATLNVDEHPDVASQFDVISIPMLAVFKDGQLLRQKVGAVPKTEIEKLFKDLV